MLVLTRRVGEVIVIGDDVLVTILSINGKHVRVGIKAPSEIGVHRRELYDRIRNAKHAHRERLSLSQRPVQL